MALPKLKDVLDKDAFVALTCDTASAACAKRNKEPRKPVAELLNHTYHRIHDQIRTEFEASNNSGFYLKAHSWLMDAMIEAAFCAANIAQSELELTDRFCCMAVGGYGRSEMFPYSDIDLMFLYDDKAEAISQPIVESILYYLWDMGLKVGYSVRNVASAISLAQADHTITANLLDRRFLCGNKPLYQRFNRRFESHVIQQDVPAFIDAKLEERALRHKKHGESRFFLEPNVKENKGAMRDLHLLEWLAKYVYGVKSVNALVKLNILTEQEYSDYKHARDFLWCVRIYLHLLSGRAEERLTFDRQKQIGETLGYRTHHEHRPVERFMKHYFQMAKNIGKLTRIFCAMLEDEHKRKPRINLGRLLERTKTIDDFVIQGQRLNFDSDVDLPANPILILKLFHVAQTQDIDIHPHALQAVSRNLSLIDKNLRENAEANRLFMEMLLSPNEPEITLRRLNEADVLGKFIPEFGHIVGQMQYDMYHVYTVDEHTIHALGILHQIESGALAHQHPLASRIIKQIESRHVLYLALLCHDVAKGTGGNHHEKGEKISLKLAARFGFSAGEALTTAWLVREHLLCSNVAFKRDLSDIRIIRDFVAQVQSPERLRLLLILTVCDIRAVGPQIWNGWKGALLRDLYQRAEEEMGTAQPAQHIEAVAHFKEQMQQSLDGWSEQDRNRYLEALHSDFLLGGTMEQHLAIAQLLRQSWHANHQIATHHEIDSFRSITRITLCLPAHPALMTHIAGAIATIDASILVAKLFVLQDGTAVALLDIQNRQGHVFDDERRMGKWPQYLLQSLSGEMDLQDAVRLQQGAYRESTEIEPHVYIDNHISTRFTVIEVNGADRVGFLYDVTHAITSLGLTIATAHISTYGQKAVDVFYVKDAFGLKITHPRKLEQIRTALLESLGYAKLPAQTGS